MPRAQPELHALVQLHADVAALKGVGVIRVRTLPIGLELVSEGIVVEARPRSRQRGKSMRRSESAAIGTETQLRSLCCSITREDLHDARHRVGAIECALRTPQELQPVRLHQGHSRSIECAARIGYGDAV